ncbi:hypothetical protein [Nocardioides sp.]|uniref:hypothetical protein n=1 Tax=Nocardioides sp. TaxID=35761 RepID=UPI003784F638
MARIGMAVAGLGAAAVLTACGGSDFADGSADDIAKSAKSAMGDLTSVTVSGEISSGGQDINIDLQTDKDGNCTGTIGLGSGSADLLGVGGDVWMKPDESFWKTFAGTSADQVISLVGDKWVVVPQGQDSLDQFCDIDSLLEQMLKDDDSSTYSKAGTGSVDGDDVVKIDNKDKDGSTSTGYVLVDDPHYLVKIEKTEGEDTGSVTFSDFDEKVDVEAPADSDVVDLNNLSG